MWRALDDELPEPAWPEDVSVRTYTSDDGRQVQAFLDDAYRAWDPDHIPRSFDSWLAFMTEHDDFDPALWFLVERDGTTRRLCAALEGVERAWLGEGHRRPRERTRGGLGKALLRHAFRAYAERGVKSVGLEGRLDEPDRRAAALRAERFRDRPAARHLDQAAMTTTPVNVSLLRWLRRQLREPTPQRERLEAAIANDDPDEARRIVASRAVQRRAASARGAAARRVAAPALLVPAIFRRTTCSPHASPAANNASGSTSSSQPMKCCSGCSSVEPKTPARPASNCASRSSPPRSSAAWRSSTAEPSA